MSTDNDEFREGQRVRVRAEASGSLFGGREGTVIGYASREWDIWVRMDTPIVGNHVYGFMARELETLSSDATTISEKQALGPETPPTGPEPTP